MSTYEEYQERQRNKADKQWLRGISSKGVALDYDGMAILITQRINDDHLIMRQVTENIIEQRNFRSMLKVGSDGAMGALAKHSSDRGMSRSSFVQMASNAIITQQIMVALYRVMYGKWVSSLGQTVTNIEKLIDINDDITAAPLSKKDREKVEIYDYRFPAFEKSWIKVENKIRGYNPTFQKSMATMRYNEAVDKVSKRNKKGFVEWEMPKGINENQTLLMGGLILDYMVTVGIVNVSMSTRGGSSYEVVEFTEEFMNANKQNGLGVLVSEVYVNELPPEVDADLQLSFSATTVGNKVSITSNNEDRGDTSVMVKAMNHLQRTGLVVDEDAKAKMAARIELINSIK